jgi:hypothetical protein
MTFLLPISGEDPIVLADALTCLATYCAEQGDEDTAARADALNDRLGALKPLVFANAHEWLRCVGLGPHYRRPQG